MSFLNPFFLIATGAALLPVLYHLVRRTRVGTVPFPSLMLLRDRQEQIVRQRRLQDLLLMAVRALLFGLLALAFARPFLPPPPLPVAGTQPQSVVMLVDRSLSMRQGEAMAAARAEVLRRLQDAGPDTEVSVVAFDDEVRQLTPLGRDRAVHRGAVERELEARYRATRFRLALERAEEILQRAHGRDRTLVLVSDFQRSGWADALDSLTLAAEVDLQTVPVGTAASGNAYLRDVRLASEPAGGALAVRYEALVVAQGASAEAEKTVRLVVDGERVAEEVVPAGASHAVTLRHVVSEGEAQVGVLEVEAAGDALPDDDRYHVTYVAGRRPRLLLVDGDAAGSGFFLERAFDLGARFRFEAAGPSRLERGRLEGFDVVVVSNVPALAADQRERLRRYVEGGGGLVVALGSRVDPSAFSEALQALGLGTIQQTVQQATYVSDVDERHPVFEVFAGASARTLWRPAFGRYAQVNPDPSARVLGAYHTGDPFVIERTRGQGRALLMTSAFDTDWTTLPVTEAFVPLVYQLAAHAARGAAPRRVFAVGDDVPLAGQPGDTWSVRTPAEETYQVTVGASGTGLFRETDVPGAYRAVHGTDGSMRYPFSVNVAPDESDLTRDAPDTLRAALRRVPDPAFAAPAVAAGPAPEDAEGRQQIWKYLLLGVVALFALETFLANRRLGRP